MTVEEHPITSVRSTPIGGWLILFLVIFAGQIWQEGFQVVLTLIIKSSAYYSYGKWPLHEASYGVEGVAAFYTYWYLFWVPLAGFVFNLLLATDSRAPKWVIRLLLITALGATIMLLLISINRETGNDDYRKWYNPALGQVIKSYLMCAVFTPYFLYSKRVKATFKL